MQMRMWVNIIYYLIYPESKEFTNFVFKKEAKCREKYGR